MRVSANLLHSVRFRLTAWYGVLMILFMVVGGFGVWTTMSTWLRNDLDSQLQHAAGQYSPRQFQRAIEDDNIPGFVVDEGGWQPPSEQPGGDEYHSMIVQVDGIAGTFNVGPSTDCVIPYDDPSTAPGGRTLSTQSACGDTFRVLAIAAGYTYQATAEAYPYAVVIAQSVGPMNDTLNTLRKLMFAIGAVGIVIALQGGWLIAGRSLRPIRSVTETASDIANSPQTAQSLSTRLRRPPGNDEVAQLTATFNAMLDRIESEFARRQRFVSDASHELRTPLAAIRGNLDVMAMQLNQMSQGTTPVSPAGQQAVQDGFADLRREASRMARLLDDLLFLARSDDAPFGPSVHREPVRLDTLAADVARTAGAMLNGQILTVDAPSPVTVSGDQDRLSQLLWILLDNAIRYTPEGGRITVAVRGQADGERAVMSVTDEGTGIADDDLPHIFDRFYRADSARGRTTGGSGLGLAIARTIVSAHGGEITAASVPGQGTRFEVVLPLLATGRAVAGDDETRPIPVIGAGGDEPVTSEPVAS